MHIKERLNFEEISDDIAYIVYEPYHETPSCFEYKYGEEKTIVLKNSTTGELERIHYKMVGSVPFSTRKGYHWFWGQVKTQDRNCYLVFNYRPSGKLSKIIISFCGKSLSDEDFHRRNRLISYAAQITSEI